MKKRSPVGKIFTSLLLVFSISLIVIFKNMNANNLTQKEGITKISVAEVTRSIFYAPQYAAISLGYFEEEGLDIELLTIPGADKVAAAVLSGDVQIGFSGAEATIYVYQGGQTDYLKSFAGLTQKDGSLILSREPITNFSLDDLIGKHIIGGRQGGMPVMSLQSALRNAGINPEIDVNIDTSIEFAAMSGAFIGGNGDFVTLFEPTALNLEKEGYGHVVASLGDLAGLVPYTAYHAKTSYIKNNPEIIQAFTNATNQGLKFVKENDSKTIANAIYEFFPDVSLEDITTVIERYKAIDVWQEDATLTKKQFDNLFSIMDLTSEQLSNMTFEDIVDTSFAGNNN